MNSEMTVGWPFKLLKMWEIIVKAFGYGTLQYSSFDGLL